ncbi:MAG: hypothetical protein A6F71_09150 [Cycloclasticus sp. symbiont of Poecilosclerida sp. M]|nr:MAG: hypothetical protein A6F71_09150 [Cycloclasticus sp. symbiont of Poecilosclerida sp. M]
MLPPQTGSKISKFLSIPIKPSKIPTKHPKSCGRVLTSKENLEIIEEKQRLKQEAQQMKEERRRARERKKIEREKASQGREKPPHPKAAPACGEAGK